MQRFIRESLEIKSQKQPYKNGCGFDTACVNVWLCETQTLQPYCQLISLLHTHEQKRAKAIRSEVSQQAYVIAHLLLQSVLAKHYGICRREQVFACNAYGKPCLAQHCHIHFNISHTAGMVAVAVSNCPVGVDVEHTLLKDPIAIAQAFFAPVERQHLGNSSCPEMLFRRYWVAKEACLKAMGVGLGTMLSQCVISAQILKGQTWQQYDLNGRHMALYMSSEGDRGHDIAVAVELKEPMVKAPTLYCQQLRSDEWLGWAFDAEAPYKRFDEPVNWGA